MIKKLIKKLVTLLKLCSQSRDKKIERATQAKAVVSAIKNLVFTETYLLLFLVKLL